MHLQSVLLLGTAFLGSLAGVTSLAVPSLVSMNVDLGSAEEVNAPPKYIVHCSGDPYPPSKCFAPWGKYRHDGVYKPPTGFRKDCKKCRCRKHDSHNIFETPDLQTPSP
ncbi:hypothetical protein SPI_05013 [Niveomyces insectorum RCEF 264]|uniref:Uncharacterized protein n=1 Tax=Niveomyces insectorum RCEF 264 TaxID=1081102 RepID=A0A167TVC6_9HYPO|nr:hypothetical protein SPI_05013 [Niveomyces insectorum RCEF 264]